MGFAGDDGSSCRRRYLPKDSFNNNKSRLQRIQNNISSAGLPRSKVIDSDVIEQIDCIDRLRDEGDCTWLSSDSATPSLLSSDDYQDIWELDCLEHTLHDRFLPVLSLANTFTTPIDEEVGTSLSESSTTIPPNKASLNKLGEDDDKKLLQESAMQPQEIIGFKVKVPAFNCLESGSYSSFGWPHCLNSPVCSNPCTPLSAYTETSSEFDGSDTWVSSLGLGMEDFSLSNEKEPEINIFGSHMPSTPTSREDHLVRLSVPSSVMPTDEEDNTKVPGNYHDSGEPLFWPFDYNSYACLDFKEFLCLSPRKERKLVDISEFHDPKSFRKTSQATRTNIKEPKRIMPSNSMSKSATCEGERIGLHYAGQGTATTSAELTQSTNEYHIQSISNRKLPKLNMKMPRNQGSPSGLLVQSLEGLELYNYVVEGVSIEKAVGLTEFIGQEGINADIEWELDLCRYPSHEFNATYRKCSSDVN